MNIKEERAKYNAFIATYRIFKKNISGPMDWDTFPPPVGLVAVPLLIFKGISLDVLKTQLVMSQGVAPPF